MINLSLENIIHKVNISLQMGLNKKSSLIPEILDIEGMSGVKFRHFLNNLCSIPNITYMEVGSYKGSTLISALYNNKTKGIAFDNWSEFNGPKDEFYANINKYLDMSNVSVNECDCFTFDRQKITDVDIYLYDGSHDTYSQYRGISYFAKCLSHPCILIVDDWNNQHGPNAQKGTKDALQDLGINVAWYWETVNFADENNGPHQNWWGAQYIAILT